MLLFMNQYLKMSRLVANFKGWETNNNIFENEINRVIRALGVGDQYRETAPKSLL